MNLEKGSIFYYSFARMTVLFSRSTKNYESKAGPGLCYLDHVRMSRQPEKSHARLYVHI
jgi:hypothetical protein